MLSRIAVVLLTATLLSPAFGPLVEPHGETVAFGPLVEPGGGEHVAFGPLVDPNGEVVAFGPLVEPGGLS